MTDPGASPAAHRASASTRTVGHEYDPGSPGAGVRRRSWKRSSARDRAAVKTSADRHTCISEATRSRPARRRVNDGSRCAAQSQTDTPPGRWNRSRFPWPFPTQIAHAGTEPRFSPL